MTITDNQLAEALADARGIPVEWRAVGRVNQNRWRAVARKARELLHEEFAAWLKAQRDDWDMYTDRAEWASLNSALVSLGHIALTPPANASIALSGTFDPLQPGDRVSVHATVVDYCLGKKDVAWVNIMFDGAQVPDFRTIDPAYLTLIERPAPPEPDWQPGEYAKDERGDDWRCIAPGSWINTLGARIVARDEIPGPLTPCDVVPRKAKP